MTPTSFNTSYAYITIVECDRSPSGKTRRWEVFEEGGVVGGVLLGHISWFGPWRRYVFRPCAETVYEQRCMRDIASFLESSTDSHKKGYDVETHTRPSP